MTEKLEYNPLSGWVKKGGVRQGRETTTERILLMKRPNFQGLEATKRIPEHKWIWETQTALAPDGEIIHLNGDKFDNRWKNLRTQDQMLVEAGKDCLEMCHHEWRFRNQQKHIDIAYKQESGEILTIETAASAIRMSDDRPVVFWAGQWFAAEDVAWFLFTGAWPERGVVMVNGDFCDLRLANLRRVV